MATIKSGLKSFIPQKNIIHPGQKTCMIAGLQMIVKPSNIKKKYNPRLCKGKCCMQSPKNTLDFKVCTHQQQRNHFCFLRLHRHWADAKCEDQKLWLKPTREELKTLRKSKTKTIPLFVSGPWRGGIFQGGDEGVCNSFPRVKFYDFTVCRPSTSR